MIKVAICDDDKEFRKNMHSIVEKHFLTKERSVWIVEFKNGNRLLASHVRFDIIFLDIEMPHMDGMELAAEIRKHDSRVVMVFVTNMARYAVNGYRVGAIDYVLKPISAFDFSLTMDRVMGAIARVREEKSYTVKSRESVTTLSASDIRYIESLNHHLIFHTSFGEQEVYGYLKDVENELGDGFFRVSSCYLINLAYVKTINGCDITIGDDVLKISRVKKSELIEKLVAYYGVM